MKTKLEQLKTKLEQLKTQLETINQFEALFASKNICEFNQQFPHFSVYMGGNDSKKTNQAFDNFDFYNNNNDPRHNLLSFAIQGLKKVFENKDMSNKLRELRQHLNNLENRQYKCAFSFFYLAIHINIHLLSDHNKDNNNSSYFNPIIKQTRELIERQEALIQGYIAEAEAKAKAEAEPEPEPEAKAEKQNRTPEAAKPFGKKALHHAGIVTLFTVGAGLTTASVLMQFSPGFVVLVGVHLTVAALAVTGVAMAAVGALLMSVAVYRLIKKNANAPKIVSETLSVGSTKQPINIGVRGFFKSLHHDSSQCCATRNGSGLIV